MIGAVRKRTRRCSLSLVAQGERRADHAEKAQIVVWA